MADADVRVPGVGPEALVVFYDGTCGLCHGVVRFLVARGVASRGWAFAPIGGETFERVVRAKVHDPLPDSIVVVTGAGTLLVLSDAVLYLLGRLSRAWASLARLLALVPRPVRDAAYRGVAAVRRRIARPPREVCPIVPRHARASFLP